MIAFDLPRQNLDRDELLERVARRFYTTPAEILGKDRHKNVADARHVVMWALRQHTTLSFPVIGRMMGGKDHTSVINAFRKIERRRGEDPRFAHDLDMLLGPSVSRVQTEPGSGVWVA